MNEIQRQNADIFAAIEQEERDALLGISRCPICGLKVETYRDVLDYCGPVLEEGESCPTKHWGWSFAYGNSEFWVGFGDTARVWYGRHDDPFAQSQIRDTEIKAAVVELRRSLK
jgi:hypothetical protein